MHAHYFAGCRLLAEENLSDLPFLEYLSAFENEAPYTHTFSLRLGGRLAPAVPFYRLRNRADAAAALALTEAYDVPVEKAAADV